MSNNSQYNVNDNDRIMEEDEEELQKDIDPEFSKILKSLAVPLEPVSEATKQKVMDGYDREYRYKIFWLQTKTKIENYRKELFIGNGRRLEISLATIIVFFILTTIAYYQYIKHQSTPTDIIAGQETPIIKVSPNPTDTPIATPSPIESIARKVATNPNNNDNIRQDGTKEENNQQAITNEDTKPRKPEEPKDLGKENDKIAMNTVPNNSSATRAVKELSKQQILTMKKLKTLRTIIIDDSLEQDIRQEIEKEIENSPNWEIATDADAMFKVVDNKLMLVNQSGEVLWFVNNHKTKYKSKVKYIKYIRAKIKYLSSLSSVKK
ncbi:MAG: hypothetical protein WAQ98_06560 [Blastocatellia bacterium]